MTETTDALAVPTDLALVLSPEAWRERTAGALKALREQIDLAVGARRSERDEQLGDVKLSESDVAPLVRDVVGVGETLRHIATGFKETADYLDGVVQEEVAAVRGADGEGRIIVGDLGTDIVAGWNRGGSTVIDPVEVDQALAAVFQKRLIAEGEDPDVAALLVDAYRRAFSDIRTYGKIEYGSTKLKALKTTLQGTGDDDVAGMVERSMRYVTSDSPKFTVKREEHKEKRR